MANIVIFRGFVVIYLEYIHMERKNRKQIYVKSVNQSLKKNMTVLKMITRIILIFPKMTISSLNSSLLTVFHWEHSDKANKNILK